MVDGEIVAVLAQLKSRDHSLPCIIDYARKFTQSEPESMLRACLVALALTLPVAADAETPEEWITLGARVHGGFGSFIPLGIRIGLDAVHRLNAKPRALTVLYYDSDSSPCACFVDGVAIATCASVGQRTLIIAPEKAPAGDAAVIVIRPRQGGPGFEYSIPLSALAKLGQMNRGLNERGRYDAVMACSKSSLRRRSAFMRGTKPLYLGV